MVANPPLKTSELYEAARLRQATLQDAPSLTTLYNRARDNQNETVQSMLGWLEHGGALLLESDENEILCALRWQEEGAGWRVDRIATLPAARGQSYGRWLMTKVEALAIRTNISTLTLTLDEVRDDLLTYYQRMGYQITQQGETSVTLEKRVGGMWQYKQ